MQTCNGRDSSINSFRTSKIGKAAKERWAKFRAESEKASRIVAPSTHSYSGASAIQHRRGLTICRSVFFPRVLRV